MDAGRGLARYESNVPQTLDGEQEEDCRHKNGWYIDLRSFLIEISPQPPLWKTLCAFAFIYLVWGTTFLAIRIGVSQVPPFLFAAMRFLAAGAVLFAWMLTQRERLPSGREWGSATLMGLLIFVVDYGLLFWAEKRVPSGIAAVMLAIIPVFMAFFEIVLLRTQRLTARLALALLVGLAGVAALMIRSLDLGGAAIDTRGAIALIIAALSWSVAASLNSRLPLPASKGMSAAAQMLAGGVLLLPASAALGEWHGFSWSSVSLQGWLALAYLVVFGSIIGFTTYLWLLHHHSPTKVGTYAYVNPVVAVIAGYFLGGEALGLRTLVGAACVLVSVLVITTSRTARVEAR